MDLDKAEAEKAASKKQQSLRSYNDLLSCMAVHNANHVRLGIEQH